MTRGSRRPSHNDDIWSVPNDKSQGLLPKNNLSARRSTFSRDCVCSFVRAGCHTAHAYSNTGRLCPTRPDQTHGQSPYMSRLSGPVYDQTESADVCGDPSGLWVWSGRVCVVEFRNDTTRSDQRQSDRQRNLDRSGADPTDFVGHSGLRQGLVGPVYSGIWTMTCTVRAGSRACNIVGVGDQSRRRQDAGEFLSVAAHAERRPRRADQLDQQSLRLPPRQCHTAH